MITCKTFDEAFLTFLQLIITGDYKTADLIFIERRNEWIVTGDGFTFERSLPSYTTLLETIETLIKVKEIGEIKDISLSYNDITEEYDYKMTIVI